MGRNCRVRFGSKLLSSIWGATVELNLNQQNKSIANKTNTQHRLLGCRGLMAIWAVAVGFFLIMLCSGLWTLASLLWPLVSGLWSPGLWKLSSGLWPLASGLWRFGSIFFRSTAVRFPARMFVRCFALIVRSFVLVRRSFFMTTAFYLTYCVSRRGIEFAAPGRRSLSK